MKLRSKNLNILILILILGGIFAVLATLYFEVSPENLYACTEDAMECPDGSYVSRTGPNCEFSACPNVTVDKGEDLPDFPYEEPAEPSAEEVEEFQFELQEAVRIELGQPIEGYEPGMLMTVFPGLLPNDFSQVKAAIGLYQITPKGELEHVVPDGAMLHSAAQAITEEGFETLLSNVQNRLQISPDTSLDEVLGLLKGSEKPTDYPVACTMDAKMCPDGSFVGRTGPDCEFETCPESKWPIRYGEDVSKMEEYRFDCEQRMGIFNECGSACPPGVDACMAVCSMICEGPADEHMPTVPPESTFCSLSSRNVDACIEIYQPVCGQVEVQCITSPCNPVPETFSNSCFACMNENVISYTEGECEVLLVN